MYVPHGLAVLYGCVCDGNKHLRMNKTMAVAMKSRAIQLQGVSRLNHMSEAGKTNSKVLMA